MAMLSDYATQTFARLSECIKDIVVAKGALHQAFYALASPNKAEQQAFDRRRAALEKAHARCIDAQLALKEVER